MTSTILERATAVLPPKLVSVSRLKRFALATATIAIVAGAGWYGTDWWRTGRFIETTDDAYAGGNVTPLSPHVAGFIAKYVLQQEMVAQAEAGLASKNAQATFAGEDAIRYRNLASTGYGTRQSAERTAAAEQDAHASVRAAQAALAAARQQLTVLQADIAAAKAGLAQATADLETARLNLGYTEIRSPIDGYIGNRAGRVGSYIGSGAYLLTVIPSQGLWVDGNFKEDQLAHMRPGQPATVVADVLPNKVFHGHVERLAPGTGAIFSVIPPENATGNFTKIVQRVPVRIALDTADARLGELRPGLSTTVSVDTRLSGRE
ncbi:MAG: HlyD family secretion protein [Alphaproteobacteria bacterium]|nr:HlyD family secretion protein [Alphaproteobacteria bacterium]